MNAFFRGLVALAVSVCTCGGRDWQAMEFGELHTNCVVEIESGSYSNLNGVKVLEYKLLAWYRIRDSRPWYVDNALCWCKMSTDNGVRWALLHMARNPEPTGHNSDLHWHSYYVYDVPNGWFRYFDQPPKNEDVYKQMTWFKFKAERGWDTYDSLIIDQNWLAALGEKPASDFSRQTVQRTGASRSAQETNRTSSAAASRRSP